jgi:hypothetical protein
MSNWQIKELDATWLPSPVENLIEELASGACPAIVFRSVFPKEACQRLLCRLVEDELLYDPREPVPDKFLEHAIPEGFYREGRNSEPRTAWDAKTATGRTRIDIGTSLGYRGSDKEAFLTHSAETHALFDRLFQRDNPVKLLYRYLGHLAPDKRVVTAYEPDGRRYGPAIIRAHYGGYTYKPHFDSVRLREKRADYAVYEFEHQFAGVLVLQNAEISDKSAQCILHRCVWTPEIDLHLKQDTFHDFVRSAGIDSVEVRLNPGDLYFFNTRLIHEVPGVAGALPRVVLATFIGYSSDRPEVFVWS